MTRAISIRVVPALTVVLCLSWPRAGAADELRPVGDEAFAVMTRWLEYESGPTDVRASDLRTTSNGRLHKLVFSGSDGRRVPAHLELPLHGQAPYPCVILIHGMSRSKEFWWSFGTTTEGKHKDRLVAEGFAVLGLDLPMHGERAAEGDYLDPAQLLRQGTGTGLRDLFAAAVVEHRRAIDVLYERADIDSSRIGVLGYEFGGSLVFALAAVEPRLRTAVACVPPTVYDGLSVRAAQNYAPRIQLPFLLLMAADSPHSSPADADQLHAMLPGSDAEVKVYTSDDRLPIWYVGDAVSWFATHLGQ